MVHVFLSFSYAERASFAGMAVGEGGSRNVKIALASGIKSGDKIAHDRTWTMLEEFRLSYRLVILSSPDPINIAIQCRHELLQGIIVSAYVSQIRPVHAVVKS